MRNIIRAQISNGWPNLRKEHIYCILWTEMKLLFAINSTEGNNRELVTCSALFQGRVQSVFLPAKNVHVDFAAISLISTHYKCMNMYRSCVINLFTYDINTWHHRHNRPFEYQKRDRLIYTDPFAQHLRIGLKEFPVAAMDILPYAGHPAFMLSTGPAWRVQGAISATSSTPVQSASSQDRRRCGQIFCVYWKYGILYFKNHYV